MSAFQIISQLILHPRSKGIPYVAEHGTLKQGITIALIVLILHIVCNTLTNLFLDPWNIDTILDTIFDAIDILQYWFLIVLIWALFLFLAIKFFVNRHITLKRILTAIGYNESLNFPTLVLFFIMFIFSNIIEEGDFLLSIILAVLFIANIIIGIYYLLCTIHLYRIVLDINRWAFIGMGLLYLVVLISCSIVFDFWDLLLQF